MANIEIYELPVVAKLSPISPGISNSVGSRLLAASLALEGTNGAEIDRRFSVSRHSNGPTYLIARIFGTIMVRGYQNVLKDRDRSENI